MGWQDDPVMNPSTTQPAWMTDPVSEEVAHPKPPPRSAGLTARDVGKVIAPAIYPTIGAVLGTLLGPGGQIVGGLGGVAVNQILGITEPSVVEPAAQVLVPGGSKGLNAYRRLFPAFGTEARAASTMNRIAPLEVQQMLKSYAPKRSSKTLFEEAERSGGTIPLPSTEEAAARELASIQESLPSFRTSYDPLKKHLKGIQQAADTGGVERGIPTSTFQRLLHDVGRHQEAADVSGGVLKKGYRDVYAGLMKDLEQAPKLADARQAYKREIVLRELKSVGRPFTKRGVGEAEQFNANKLINRLNDSDDLLTKSFRSAFTPKEQQEILGTLTILNKIPPIPPGAGQSFGSGKFWTQTAPSLVTGGTLGYASGNPLAGLVMGAGAPAAQRYLRDFSLAWQTQEGKALIQNLLAHSGGKFTPQVWSAIQAFAASQFAQPKHQPDPRLQDITIQKSMPDAIRAANVGIDARAR